MKAALWLVVAVLLVALPLLARMAGTPATVGLATQIAIYAIAAMSLNLILGYGGLVSFGHAAFFGLGGYTVGILYQHATDGTDFLGLIPGSSALLVVLPAAMLVAGLGAALIGALSLRTGGIQFIMITLAFAQMLFFLFVSLKTYGGDDGLMMRRRDALPFFDTRDPFGFYWLCLGLCAAWLLVTARIVRSRFGMVIEGLRQNERRMAAMGVPAFRYRLAAFVIAGMGAGLAGALMANYLRFVSPDMMHWTKSGELMMMVILGGVGTLAGPILGAATLVLLESLLAARTEYWQLPLGLVLLAVVLFTHGGLTEAARRLRSALR